MRPTTSSVLGSFTAKGKRENIAYLKVQDNTLGLACLLGKLYIRKQQATNNSDEKILVEKEIKCFSLVNDRTPNSKVATRVSGRTEQENAGITITRDFTMADAVKMQDFYGDDYQIVVFNEGHNMHPVYKGPMVPNKMIPLLYTNGRFDLIRSVPAYVGTRYYCIHCEFKGPSRALHYNCPLLCRKCSQDDCAGPAQKVPCMDCKIVFKTIKCFNNHKMRGPQNGKSRCEQTLFCDDCETPYYVNKGMVHMCGQKYCQTCRTSRDKDHICFMAVRNPPTKKNQLKRIYFDIETRTHGDNDELEPVLIMALRCCSECSHEIPNSLSEARYLKCSTCSPDGKRFWQFDCVRRENRNLQPIKMFCEWLFHKRHSGFSVLAHNLGRFDGQFVLQWILEDRNCPQPNLIMDGTKIQYLSVDNIKLLDSYNFVAAPLASFSKAFNIPTLVKGMFPFLFIKPINYDYQGPYPDKMFYNYKDKTEEQKKAFDEFHNEMVTSNKVFNFQQDLETYCYADVALLAASMTSFEKTFFQKTKVTLFSETVTSAGAALLTFQRGHLKANTLCLDMNPVGTSIKQSKVAKRYLGYREHVENEEIVREFKIPDTSYRVDGYIAPCLKYPEGLAIEIKGCYWHACTCLYDDGDIVHDELMACVIRKRDLTREKEITEFCPLEIVRECEIRNDMATNPKLQFYISTNVTPGPVIAREALFGGRTEPIKMFADVEDLAEGNKICYRDFTSLYPYVMKYCSYPIGVGKQLSPLSLTMPISTPSELTVKGLVACKIVPPRNLHIPVLPFKGSKLFFTLCRTCAEEASEGIKVQKCDHTDDDRTLIGTWTTFELELALENGYLITQVTGILHFDKWLTYSKNGENVEHGVFSTYIDTFAALKQENSGWPENVTTEEEKLTYIDNYKKYEGIDLEYDKIRKDPVCRQVSKLLLNSLWGKFGQRTDKFTTHITKSDEELDKLFSNPTIRIECVPYTSVHTHVVITKKIDDCIDPLPTSAMPYAVLTTSHARCTLYKALKMIPNPKENILYMDTDSIVYVCHRDDDPLESLSGNYLGQLTDEITPNCEMTSFVTIGPKSYAYEETTIDSEEKTSTIKCKGMPRNAEFEKTLTFQEFKNRIEHRLNETEIDPLVLRFHQMKRDKLHCIFMNPTTKKFQVTMDKRVMLSDGTTLPFGF